MATILFIYFATPKQRRQLADIDLVHHSGYFVYPPMLIFRHLGKKNIIIGRYNKLGMDSQFIGNIFQRRLLQGAFWKCKDQAPDRNLGPIVSFSLRPNGARQV